MTMDTVKVSVSKLNNGNPETAMFAEEYSFEFNLSEKIMEAKAQYKNALEAYFDGVIKGISASINSGSFSSVFELKRLEVMKKKHMALKEYYMNMLGNFSIKGIDSVSYLGREFDNNESVRRFTQIHLEELHEVEQVYSAPVINSKREYEALLHEFLKVVRMSSFGC